MAINFPNSPSDQDTYTDPTSGNAYRYHASSQSWRAYAPALPGSLTYLAKNNVDYTLTASDHLVNWQAGSKTATLPSAATVGAGKEYILKNSGSGTITVETTSSQTIDGLLKQYIGPKESITVFSDGANWFII